MLNAMGSKESRAREAADESPAPEAFQIHLPADFMQLSGDEIERLIALCEAPSVLWCNDTSPARAPEPFGMIA